MARIWTQKPPLGSQINWGHPLARGLVGYWLMNEGGGMYLNDLSGNNNKGTLTNGAAWSLGKGLSFDGVNDYVSVANSASLNTPNSNGTISVWIKPSAYATYQSIVFKRVNGNNFDYGIDMGSAGNKLRCMIRSAVSGIITSSTAVPLNVWSFVTFTWDGTNLNVYLNGVSDATPTSQTGNAGANVQNLQIGIGYPEGFYFNGLIDDVRIHNRALSANEIRSIYASPYQFIYRPTQRFYSIADSSSSSSCRSSSCSSRSSSSCSSRSSSSSSSIFISSSSKSSVWSSLSSSSSRSSSSSSSSWSSPLTRFNNRKSYIYPEIIKNSFLSTGREDE